MSTQEKIINYFSPHKRLRLGSPNSSEEGKNSCLEENIQSKENSTLSKMDERDPSTVQPSWATNLISMVQSLNEKVEKVATKDDLLVLNNKIDQYSATVDKLGEDFVAIKQENIELKDKINRLENHVNRNNLIFRGVPTGNDYVSSIKSICLNVLKVEKELNIIQAFPVGINGENSKIIKAEFGNYSDVLCIKANTINARGSGISVYPDLTLESRTKRINLLKLKREIKNVAPGYQLNFRDCEGRPLGFRELRNSC